MDYTIYFLDKVAKEATARIEQEFKRYNYKNPPKFSNAMIRIVMECAEEVKAQEPDKVSVK